MEDGVTLKERFERKVSRSNSECWLWIGHRAPNGYGMISVDNVPTGAHRVSYELYKGAIPPGRMVLHACDVRCCVNPDHLWLGTHDDNMIDAARKGRMARGVDHVHARVTDDTVRRIRELVAAGAVQREVAAEFGISQSSVSLIARRIYWRHVA